MARGEPEALKIATEKEKGADAQNQWLLKYPVLMCFKYVSATGCDIVDGPRDKKDEKKEQNIRGRVTDMKERGRELNKKHA
eukprot:gene1529-914_t